MKIKLLISLKPISRRNNVKFCGISKIVKKNDLKKFLQKIIIDFIPTLQNQELVIDRAHRLPKPPHIPEKLPRDVIAKMHFFQMKDMLMQYARHHTHHSQIPMQG